MTLGRTTPILRIFDEAKAREFYVDFLGFTIDWEHRFEPGLPLYAQVSRDGCVLHLSEHYGDGCPGTAVRIDSTQIDALHAELTAKRYKHARPGIGDHAVGHERDIGQRSVRQSADICAARVDRRGSQLTSQRAPTPDESSYRRGIVRLPSTTGGKSFTSS